MKQMYAKQIKFRLTTMKQMVWNAMNIIQITQLFESCTKKFNYFCFKFLAKIFMTQNWVKICKKYMTYLRNDPKTSISVYLWNDLKTSIISAQPH